MYENLEYRINNLNYKIKDLESKVKDLESKVNDLELKKHHHSSSRGRGYMTFYAVGSVIATIISWDANHSVLWAILHCFSSWFYIIYHFADPYIYKIINPYISQLF